MSEAFEIVQQLGKIVSANELDGTFVVDAALLTHPKSGIKSAVALLIERGVADHAAFARSAVPTLAFFQSGVGEGKHSIDSSDPDGKPWKNTVETEMFVITESLPK